ncbi:MAG: signal peptidase I [Bacillota bacterium]|nr:signal peptidase I [Bacillota bacterium]MDW7684202.1 signal peptidase I [Bacillota bacterium]
MKIVTLLTRMIFVLLLLVLIPLLIIMFQDKGLLPKTVLSNFKPLTVISDSMSPTLKAGHVVVIRNVPSKDIEPGDIITFNNMPESETYITHRVVKVNSDGSFITRGDANQTNDLAPVPAENVVGRVIVAIPYFGYLVEFTRSKLGMIIMIILPGLLILVCEVRNLARYLEKSEAPS